MANYCVNTNEQPGTRDHEVHNLDANCKYLPLPSNRRGLGAHPSCASAVTAAKRIYSRSNGCATCSSACHTS